MPLIGMTRRALWPCLLAGSAAATPTADTPLTVRSGGGALRLLYVGADDCAPCRQWRASHWSVLRGATVFSPVRFIEIRAPRAAHLLRDEHWPEPLRALRQAIPSDAAVPLWFLIDGDAIAMRAWGEQGWRDTILPALRRATAARTDATTNRRTRVPA